MDYDRMVLSPIVIRVPIIYGPIKESKNIDYGTSQGSFTNGDVRS